jgi:hypothetical protein
MVMTYFQAHKNKKPKKAKYSKPLTKEQYKNIEFLKEYFDAEINKIMMKL